MDQNIEQQIDTQKEDEQLNKLAENYQPKTLEIEQMEAVYNLASKEV